MRSGEGTYIMPEQQSTYIGMWKDNNINGKGFQVNVVNKACY